MAHFWWMKSGLSAVAMGSLLSGCHPVEHRHMGRIAPFDHPAYTKVVDRLNCPDREGRLVRNAMAADGRSCGYGDDNGETVALTLLALNGGSANQALAPVENDLKAVVPYKGDDAQGVHIDHDDHTRIDMPGLHINADGEKAQVRLPGISVDADGDKAKVHAGFDEAGADVDADDNGAVIRSGSANRRGADLAYVLASKTPGPTGVRTAGYIARGPASGPLVVATFKATRSEHGDNGDVDRLVNLNLGR